MIEAIVLGITLAVLTPAAVAFSSKWTNKIAKARALERVHGETLYKAGAAVVLYRPGVEKPLLGVIVSIAFGRVSVKLEDGTHLPMTVQEFEQLHVSVVTDADVHQ